MNTKTDKTHALFVAHKILASLVYNMAVLEGNPLTFPEVKILLEGITVGGHKVCEDEEPMLAFMANCSEEIAAPFVNGRNHSPPPSH